MFDEEEEKSAAGYQPGQSTEDMSVEEITEAIAMLKADIARLEAARDAKSAHLNAAEALFAAKK